LADVVFIPRLGATSGPSLSFFFTNTTTLFDSNYLPDSPTERKVFNAFLAERVSLKTTFYSMDKNAFNYLATLAEADNWNSNTSGFVPNLREPLPVFSNVSGGVGVFGAVNRRVAVTKIQ
jgi:Domain of unknown function (DUF4249)